MEAGQVDVQKSNAELVLSEIQDCKKLQVIDKNIEAQLLDIDDSLKSETTWELIDSLQDERRELDKIIQSRKERLKEIESDN